MRFLIDMNLSPKWAGVLEQSGIEAGALVTVDTAKLRITSLPIGGAL